MLASMNPASTTATVSRRFSVGVSNERSLGLAVLDSGIRSLAYLARRGKNHSVPSKIPGPALALGDPAVEFRSRSGPAVRRKFAHRESQTYDLSAMRNLSLLRELWAYMRIRKRWWLLPIILFVLVLGSLVILAEGSALAPFIYTIF